MKLENEDGDDEESLKQHPNGIIYYLFNVVNTFIYVQIQKCMQALEYPLFAPSFHQTL